MNGDNKHGYVNSTRRKPDLNKEGEQEAKQSTKEAKSWVAVSCDVAVEPFCLCHCCCGLSLGVYLTLYTVYNLWVQNEMRTRWLFGVKSAVIPD
jgi:hypothetical protein